MKLSQKWGLGTWAFGGDFYGPQRNQDSLGVMQAFWDAGGRHFDTAQVYGKGAAEQLLGRFLKGKTGFTVATKSFLKDPQDFVRGFEKSLKRLNLEQVTTLFIHWPDSRLPWAGVLDRMMELKEKNLIQNLGLSNFAPSDVTSIKNAYPIEIYQGAYNLLFMEPRENLFPLCREKKIFFEAYSPLAQGLLAGRFLEQNTPQVQGFRSSLVFYQKDLWPPTQKFLQELRDLSQEVQIPMGPLSLAWLGSQDLPHRTLLGPRTPEQLLHLFTTPDTIDPGILAKIQTMAESLFKSRPHFPNIFNHKT